MISGPGPGQLPGIVRGMSSNLMLFSQMQSEPHSGNRRTETERRRKALQTLVSHHGRRCAQGMCGCTCARYVSSCYQHPSKHVHYSYKTTGPLSEDLKETGNNTELHSPKERKLISLTQDWSVRVCPCLWSLFWGHHLGNQCPPTAWRSGPSTFL